MIRMLPITGSIQQLRSYTKQQSYSENHHVDIWIFSTTASSSHEMLTKQAVISAKKHSPHMTYLCQFHGDNEEFVQWLSNNGVIVAHMDENPFLKQLFQLQVGGDINHLSLGIGTWMRMVIPQTLEALQSPLSEYDVIKIRNNSIWENDFKSNEINMDIIFYSDADVLFVADIQTYLSSCTYPKYISFAVQGSSYSDDDNYISKHIAVNAGVMLMNVPNYYSVWSEFEKYVISYIQMKVHDDRWVGSQGALRNFFPIQIGWSSIFYHSFNKLRFPSKTVLSTMMQKYYSESLPKELEWEPYLGINNNAKLLHFHGPKLTHIDCTEKSVLSQRNDKYGLIQLLKTKPYSNEAQVLEKTQHLYSIFGLKTRQGYYNGLLLYQEYWHEICNVPMNKTMQLFNITFF